MTNTNNITSSSVDFHTRYETWQREGLPLNPTTRLRAIGTYDDAALATVEVLVTELSQRMERDHAGAAVDTFLAASASWKDGNARYATLRSLEFLSQLPGEAQPRRHADAPANLRRRVLSSLERGLVRHAALSATMRVVLIGALDAGIASAELARLDTSHLARDTQGRPTHYLAPGSTRESASGYPAAAPRTLVIPTWSQEALAFVAKSTPASAPLLYNGTSTSPTRQQSTILMAVNGCLERAGFGDDKTVTPLSVRNTAARAIYDESGLEAAAAFLGHEDLGSVAREIGIREHRPLRKR